MLTDHLITDWGGEEGRGIEISYNLLNPLCLRLETKPLTAFSIHDLSIEETGLPRSDNRRANSPLQII